MNDNFKIAELAVKEALVENANKDKDLIDMLRSAMADEWLAYYQYWIGFHICENEEVKDEFLEHAREEKEHADILAECIMELGGKPVTNFKDILRLTKCGYSEPKSTKKQHLISENIKSEEKAINFYKEIILKIQDKHTKIKEDLKKIKEDEEKHSEDLRKMSQ